MTSNLKSSSISLLYNGMYVKDDIFDSNSARLLVKEGVVLNERLISAIRKLNSNMDTIYVSAAVHEDLSKREVLADTIMREELEEATGYTEAKDRTIELLNDTANSRAIQKQAISNVASDLSESLGITSSSIIATLINALAPIDEYQQRHCVNLSLLNGLFGRWLGMPQEEVDKLVLIGLLHDCGKALIPHHVLNAPRRLTVTEFEAVKMHSVHSFDLTNDFPNKIREAVGSHHERMDGTGYPYRLKGEEISLEARITAIGDIYDALVSQRSYKKSRSPFSALAAISALRGSALDSELSDFFIKQMSEELLNKKMLMSDGSFGIVRSYDLDNIEHPIVEINDVLVTTSEKLHCVSLNVVEEVSTP